MSSSQSVKSLTTDLVVFSDKPPLLEETPKWQALKQVLEEVEGEIQQMVSSGDLTSPDDCRVLVCAEDDRTCNQLKEVWGDCVQLLW